ncbi:ABC transporter substrate-binding protein [Paenibacillus crassostreae]|uniref:ABC transporter substrate-binding protein n=1 Tax=Paenibacillus crassostreae TaxID=1763538 RepID=A0A167BG10_9BACL|nr:ABC transporter substrate-binding protein [Paenibacillus crassostreae]AOZ92874.1 ABC transporter substrate-binding protein [Paenibacillus crassostreae]OAB72036.1 ABC transporter substrate-binding protein [Paenibacillus crassostreae]
MKKKLSSMMLILLVMITILSACAGNNTVAPAEETPPATVTETVEPAETEPTEVVETEAGKNDGIFPASDLSLNPAPAVNRTDTLIVGMTAPNGTFSPFFWSTVYDKYVVETVFDSFLEVQGDGTFKESLAESVEVSEDGLKYTFKLKPGVKYSDGTPVTVNDYLFALKVYLDPTYDGESDILSLNIAGAKEFQDGKSKDISGVTIIDDNTIEINVTEITATTKDSLGIIEFVPEAYYGKGYAFGKLDSIKELNDKPIGTGKYILKSYAAGQEVVFEANPDYFNGAPKIKNLIYKVTTDDTKLAMLQAGEIDMDMVTVNEDNVEELQLLGFLDVNIYPTNGYGYVAFNHELAKFSDVKVRQALTIGLNRADIVEGVYGIFADVINVPESKVGWAYTDEGVETYDFDIEKAKTLLDEAGWVVGSDGIREKDGEKFKIDFSATAENPVVDALLPIMTKNYKELGLDFSPETLDFNAIMAKKDEGDFDMYFAAWGLTPDPDNTVYITDGAQNDIGYSNAKVDELMKKGKVELDQAKRKEIYKEMYQELNADLPYIYMYQRRDMWAINGRIKGFDLTPYKHFTFSLNQVEVAQ